jgi:hypothetical protein
VLRLKGVVDFAEMTYPAWIKQVFWTVVSVGGLLAWFALYYVPAKIDSQTKGISTDVASLKTDVANVKTDTKRVNDTVGGLLKQLVESALSSLKATKKQSNKVANDQLEFVASIVARARDAGVNADTAIVVDAGKNTLQLTNNPELRVAALKTAQQLLDYRSFLTPTPPLPELTKADLARFWSTGTLPFTVTSVTFYSWTTSPNNMALFETFQDARNRNASGGPSLISLNGKGGELQIDQHRARNVIFNHLRIVYRGGRVDLQNVYFVDCTFDVSTGSPEALRFARTLVTSSPANFTS